MVRDLDAHRRRAFRDESSTWRDQAHGAERSFDATATSIGAQLAHDARHVWRHVLNDPDAQLDRFDRRTVVHANLAVKVLVDFVAAPSAVVSRRRCLLHPAVVPSLDHHFVRVRDRFAEISILAVPQRVAAQRRRHLLAFLEGRVFPEAFANRAIDHFRELERDFIHHPRRRRCHGQPPSLDDFAAASRIANSAITSASMVAAAASRSSKVEVGPSLMAISRSIMFAISTACGLTVLCLRRISPTLILLAPSFKPVAPNHRSSSSHDQRSGLDPP
ncbi:MAG TPA: hypothetical protein VMZ53_04725, partial [Kofleriaceae bacterium]|nr:hypothetical protein [Kofleriaceae bacterium]